MQLLTDRTYLNAVSLIYLMLFAAYPHFLSAREQLNGLKIICPIRVPILKIVSGSDLTLTNEIGKPDRRKQRQKSVNSLSFTVKKSESCSQFNSASRSENKIFNALTDIENQHLCIGGDCGSYLYVPVNLREEEQTFIYPHSNHELPGDTSTQNRKDAEKKVEFLPILSYDTETGFGYGAKLFLRNLIEKSESFDFTLFNSTRGEKWYRTVISIPDFELRQASAYPFALDIIVDFNKWIAYKFYGTGNKSRVEDKITYTHEVLELSLTANHGFTKESVIQVGIRHKEINNLKMDLSAFANLSGIKDRVKYRSIFSSVRYDSRDSYINPSNGIVLQTEFEKTVSHSNFFLWKTTIKGFFILQQFLLFVSEFRARPDHSFPCNFFYRLVAIIRCADFPKIAF
jgi:hypothetical protein